MNKAWNWNKVSSKYWSEPSEDVYYYLNRWKKKQLNNFLDLGCGIGRHALFFAENGFTVTGYDLSKSGLNIMKEKAKKSNLDIKIVQGNISELQLIENTFDCILAYHSIYHSDTEQIKDIIKEIKRVLRVGGEIYMTFISKQDHSYKYTKYERIDDNSIIKPEEDGSLLPHFYVNYEDIKNVLDGFEIIRIRHIEDFYDDKSSWHYFVHAALL